MVFIYEKVHARLSIILKKKFVSVSRNENTNNITTVELLYKELQPMENIFLSINMVQEKLNNLSSINLQDLIICTQAYWSYSSKFLAVHWKR